MVPVRPADQTVESLPDGQVDLPLHTGNNMITIELGARHCGFKLLMPTTGKLGRLAQPLVCRGADR